MNIISFNKDIVFPFCPAITIGMFDGVHIGHRKLLKELVQKAKELNTQPVIITFSNHPQTVLAKQNGREPIGLLQTNKERFESLAVLGLENIVTIPFTAEFARKSAITFLNELCVKYNPCYLLLGYDNHFGSALSDEKNIDATKALQDNGLVFERTNTCVSYNGVEVSSTQIRHALSEGDITLANAMLGSPYSFEGIVQQGNHIGETLAYKTANITPSQEKLLPLFGVYESRVWIGDKKYHSITNIGSHPTVKKSLPLVETHILNFSQDIYGTEVKVELLRFLRPEKKFASLCELKAQIEKDIAQIQI